MDEQRPKVGMGVMIFKDGRVLMGKRKSSHGIGEWAFPGGHLEYMETFEDCAKREVFEETGIEIQNVVFLHVANVLHYAPKHYVNLVVSAEWKKGEATVCEPEKTEEWGWYGIDHLPEPLFVQTELAITSYKTGKKYYDNIK